MSLLLANRAIIKSGAFDLNLVADWPGGSVIDTIGNYDGTLNGSPLPLKSVGINGVADTAYKLLAPNSQYIQFGNISELNNVQNISIAAWVKKSASGRILIASLDSVVNTSFGLGIQWYSDNQLYAFVRNGESNTLRLPDTASLLDKWTHIVLTFDGTDANHLIRSKLYVNGTRVGVTVTGNTPSLTDNKGYNFQIGKWYGTNYDTGEFAHTQVYNKTLTPAEIAALYAEKTI